MVANMPPMRRIPDDVAAPWNGEEPPFFKGMQLAQRKMRLKAFVIQSFVAVSGMVCGWALGRYVPLLVCAIVLFSATCMLVYFAATWLKAEQRYYAHIRQHNKPLVVVRDKEAA